MNDCNCSAGVEIGIDCTAMVWFKLPTGAELSDYTDIRLTGCQNDEIMFRKHIDSVRELEDGRYYFPITRNDTRKLDEHLNVELQIWWESGDSAGDTPVKSVPVRELLGGFDDA